LLNKIGFFWFVLMNADRCKGIAEASGFADVLSCKKSSIRLRSLERPPAIVLMQEATLSGLLDNMSPTAIFNRFDLSASNGQHCGEYRVIYHKNNGLPLLGSGLGYLASKLRKNLLPLFL
jgi:hypothetical protein